MRARVRWHLPTQRFKIGHEGTLFTTPPSSLRLGAFVSRHSDHLLEKVTGANATTTEDKDEAGKVWLEQRAQRERLSAQRLSAAS